MEPLNYDFENSLGAAVLATARRLRLAMTAELEPFGISYAQWTILALLVRLEGVHQNEIAERLELEPSTICRTLDGMERDGWIARQPCPDDRRRKLIVLGDDVRPTWKALKKIAQRVRRDALRGIPEAKTKAVFATLAKVRENLARAQTKREEAAA